MTPRGVLFDLDGTLVDSAPDIAAAANAALRDAGLGEVSVGQVQGWVGRGAAVLFRDALEALGERADIDTLVRSFVAHYDAHPVVESRLYPGAVDAIEALQPRRMGVVTNKFEHIARRVLATFAIDHLFAAVVGGDTCSKPKPDPAPLLHAFAGLGIEPRQGVLVGDSINDVRAARAAGCPVVCVTYGYNHGEDIATARPDATIDHLTELPAVLGRIDSRCVSG